MGGDEHMRQILFASAVLGACVLGTSIAHSATRELEPSERDLLQRELFKQLKDPDSAKVRWPAFLGGTAYCGFFNAKNSYGGYVGYQAFMASVKKKDGVIVTVTNVLVHRAANDVCSSIGYSDS